VPCDIVCVLPNNCLTVSNSFIGSTALAEICRLLSTVQGTYFFCCSSFDRAMLCVSAIFAVTQCLSVCLSCWCIVSRRLKISSDFFLGPVAPNSSFFLTRAPIPNSQGNPFNRGAKYRGVGNFFYTIFDSNCRLSRKWYKIGPWLL